MGRVMADMAIAPLMTTGSILVFVLLAIDEDKEA